MTSAVRRWCRAGAVSAFVFGASLLSGASLGSGVVLAGDAAGVPAAAHGASARLFVEKKSDEATAFAVSLKADPGLFTGRTPHDHVIVVDTSASQVGEHRTQSHAVLRELLSSLPADDRVCLVAADVQTVKLTSSFVSPQDASVEAALKVLSRRAPLGATNLAATLKDASAMQNGGRDSSIVYIGDGMSTAGLMGSDTLHSLCADLRGRRIAVHSYAVGPRLDLQLLGILAQQTGGVVMVDRAHEIKDNAAVAARRLAKAIDAPILYPDRITTQPALTSLLPQTALPVRGDRETIYVGRSNLPETVKLTVADGQQSMTWTVARASADEGHAFLSPVYRFAESTGGVSVSFAGNDMLMAARQNFDDQVSDLVARGERAVAQRQLKEAEAIAKAIREIDPENVSAKVIEGAAEKAAARMNKGGIRQVAQAQAPAAEPPPPPQPGAAPQVNDPNSLLNDPNAVPADDLGQGGDLIEQERRRIEVKGQQLQLEVNNTINSARRLINSDPEAALNQIKSATNLLRVTDDINPDLRQQLLRRLEISRAEVAGRQEVAALTRIQAAERLAQLEAQQRLLEQMQRDEDKLDQLIDRVRGLMLEGFHGNDDAYEQAEAVARIAGDLRPDSGTTAAALFVAEAAGQLRKAFRLRSLRADKFLETLYQVELSHVPFPDEPPVLWPPAEVWKSLTERRKKWASVDLHKNSPAEERIQSALRDQTEIEFVDTPLKEAMEFLSDLHNITIILDETALMEEGVATDEPINRVLAGITLRSAMKIILEPMGLTYIIEDEVMKITTQVKADEKLSTRVYPVGDLVIPITTPLAGGIGQGLGGVGGFGGQGGLGGQGGQFGLGGAGYGGGQGFGGGGLGGGFFSVDDDAVPDVESSSVEAEVRDQAFAQVKDSGSNVFDNDAVKAAKKKLGPAR